MVISPKTPWPPGKEVDAEPRALFGCGVGHGATVEAHDATVGRDEPGRDARAPSTCRRRWCRAGRGPRRVVTSKLTPKRIWTCP